MSATDDVVALQRLQQRYADVVTRRAWPELAELFRPDTVVEVDTVTRPLVETIGPEAFGRFVAGAIERFDFFAFTILSSVVDLGGPDDDPDRARGRFFMREVRHETAIDEWNDAFGVYSDRYVRIDGRWWIAARRYRSMGRTGTDGTVHPSPLGLGPLGGDAPWPDAW